MSRVLMMATAKSQSSEVRACCTQTTHQIKWSWARTSFSTLLCDLVVLEINFSMAGAKFRERTMEEGGESKHAT